MIQRMTPIQLYRGLFFARLPAGFTMSYVRCLFVTTTLLLCAPCATAESIEISGPTMGTYFKVVIENPPADFDAEAMQQQISELLEEINAQMSTWDRQSELSRFNAQQTTDWFAVSPELVFVVAEAQRIHKLTNGAFDPSVEPLIRLWGFGDGRKKSVPSADEITAAKKQCGLESLESRTEPPALRKLVPQLQVNLSAIAKGYAVDALSELLTTSGLKAHVVDIGGENRVGTAKSTGAKWKLGVESPLGGLHKVVPLTSSAIATSGDYRNYFQMDGETYSHAIDPQTGWPVKNPPASVSVIADSCMTADAWATALMVQGVEAGAATAKANGLSVMFQQVSDGEVVETAFGQFTEETAAAGQDKPKAAAMPWFPFVAAAVLFVLAIGGMAIGTMIQNKSIKGSCGGLASMPGSEGKSICELCSIPKDECTNAELREQMQAAAAAQAVEGAPQNEPVT